MTDAQQKAIAEMREQGFAIAIWYPEELNGRDRVAVEEVMVDAAADFIQD